MNDRPARRPSDVGRSEEPATTPEPSVADGEQALPLLGEDADGAPLEEVVTERPLEAVEPLRSPWALGGTAIAGAAMGVAEVVPGFSGGTVALVVGIYERLIASIRQGARTLSLLVRARPADAWRAFLAIEWPFVVLLLIGMLTAILTLAGPLEALLDERPLEMQAVFLGLVLGAALVASRQLRAATAWHVLVGVASAATFFVVLGWSPGMIEEPTGLLLLVGGAIAVCAWILPGVSGSFLLLIIGLYGAVIGAFAERDLISISLVAVGCVLGLASFSTLLNWLLAHAHDVVLAVLIGLMVGSVRVLWPWPADGTFGNTELGAPQGAEAFLVMALVLAAFAVVWMFGLASTAIQRRVDRAQAPPPS